MSGSSALRSAASSPMAGRSGSTAPALVSGFFATERGDGICRRWTDGYAVLDLPSRPNAGVLELRVLESMAGWRCRMPAAVAM